MMASIDEDDVGSGVSSSGQNKSIVIQVETKYLIQSDLIVTFFNVAESQTTEEERSARYASTSHSDVLPLHLEVREAVIIGVLGVKVGWVSRRYSHDRDYRDSSEPPPRHGRDYRDHMIIGYV
ncbi:hypothetical protein Tco_0658500 [Tanacetum coccineum]